ncbi:hypothetical protein J4429_03285 [Candidatus Pacearchaeota archaeon]|nr:hypothetical protein [Candidatus Pacearchaeota archaeon]
MTQECVINKEFRNNVFSEIERTGVELNEQLKGQMIEFQETMKKRIDAQVNLAKFEASYAFNVPKFQRAKTMKEVKEVRQEMWKEALKKANGDSKLAYTFYMEENSFP